MRAIFGLIELQIAFIGLVCFGSGIALCLYTLKVWREARPESPALAPLEVMSDDEFIEGDDRTRRDLLHMAREIALGVERPPVRDQPTPTRRPSRPAPRRHVEASVEDEPVRRGPIDPLLK